MTPEAEFLYVIGPKVLKIFLLAIHSPSTNGFEILIPRPP
jgi:hypothetical protein